MLSSSFSENGTLPPGERKIHTIVVEEADFETIYWLLKYCYANWLSFKPQDDPRSAVEGVGLGWSAKWLNSRENEWDWKTFHKSGPSEDAIHDGRSATSGESVGLGGVSRSESGSADRGHGPSTNPPTSMRASTSKPLPSAATTAVSTSGYSPASHFPVSPRPARSAPDPHPHPTPAPPPASALAMYQVAHRYSMRNLALLALEHIMSTLTPESCFAVLLASYTWDELHSLVEDYVIDKWEEVSVSEEFERCCAEVAAGEWGADGGTTLMSVFRRLRAPSTAAT
ncbi:hypothetical protein EST38_g3915 [Candolleomyces aberdarensis]|uniref:BTB domain-containing protein n=1 Tax=Candolleomyces aberdarensis TaxID=2316362 RepID=A0A4Q2DPM0_9AGAR|nr:hypothetical protein EST38_g3915 [Candolleomyces aberdarensis]